MIVTFTRTMTVLHNLFFSSEQLFITENKINLTVYQRYIVELSQWKTNQRVAIILIFHIQKYLFSNINIIFYIRLKYIVCAIILFVCIFACYFCIRRKIGMIFSNMEKCEFSKTTRPSSTDTKMIEKLMSLDRMKSWDFK